jgi:hypothetical protein
MKEVNDMGVPFIIPFGKESHCPFCDGSPDTGVKIKKNWYKCVVCEHEWALIHRGKVNLFAEQF